MKINKEVKIGLITIITIAGFYWLFRFLQGQNLFTRGEIYYVAYNNVDGLLPTKPVNVNGLKVGSVEEIKIIEKTDSLYFVVKMVLNRKFDFSVNTVAEIYEPGLMAGKQIKLILDYDGKQAKSGDTLKAANTASLMSMLSNKLQPTQNKIDSVLVTLNGTLDKYGNLADEETNKSLKSVLKSLDHTIQSLDQTSQSITSMAQSTQRLANNLDAQVGGLSSNANQALVSANSTIKEFNEVAKRLNTEEINKTLANLQTSSKELKDFVEKIESSDGTLNKLITNKELYDNLSKTSENLNILVRDFKDNPNRYIQFSVFGKKVKQEKQTEEKQ